MSSKPVIAPGRRPALPVLQILMLMVVAAVCAATTNLLRPDGLPWVEDWSNRIEAQALDLGILLADADAALTVIDEGTHLIFDARPAADFEVGHLPGALSLPSDEFDILIGDYLPLLFPEQPILVYCSGEACDESILVSRALIDMGFTNIVLFPGGTKAWVDAGYPVEDGP